MDKFDRKALGRRRDEFTSWTTAKDMFSRADALMDEINPGNLFNVPQAKFITEAWGGAKFARILHGPDCRVRLHPDDRPDFEIDPGRTNEPVLFEFTMAIYPGRRLGDEYRNWTGEIELEYEDAAPSAWKTRSLVLESIRAVANKKAAKMRVGDYPEGAQLLIYVNFSGASYGAMAAPTANQMREATIDAGAKFDAVYLLWSDHVIQVWPSIQVRHAGS